MITGRNSTKFLSSAKSRTAARTAKLVRGEMLTMKREMRNLIRELKANGMKLDESKIFVA